MPYSSQSEKAPCKSYFMLTRKMLWLNVYWFCNHVCDGNSLRRLLFFIKKRCYKEVFRGEEALYLQLILNVQKNIIICLSREKVINVVKY